MKRKQTKKAKRQKRFFSFTGIWYICSINQPEEHLTMKKKAEKLVHTRELNLYFDGLHDLSFSDAIEELKEAEKAALEEVRIYGYTDEFIGFKIKSIVDDMYRVEAMFQETDESYKKRLKREKDFDKKQKQLELQREREEYERLKKKFEEA